MSLRSTSTGARRSATAAILVLAGLLGLGLATSLARELRPSAERPAPAQTSRLVAVLEGVMAVNVSPAEQARFKTWVASGATRQGYDQVAAIVTNNCASCHDRGGQYPRITRFEDLQPIALEPAPTLFGSLITPRTLHLFGFPALMLVMILGFLRRLGGPGWHRLAGTAVLAVVGDVAQWTWRQGSPEHAWAGWLAAALLGLAMAAAAGRMLRSLWGPGTGESAP